MIHETRSKNNPFTLFLYVPKVDIMNDTPVVHGSVTILCDIDKEK